MTSIERLRELDRWLERRLAGEDGEELTDEQARRLLEHARQPLDALERPPASDPAFGSRLAKALAESGEVGPGQVIGPFEINEVIGSGGMGVVYRARRVDGGFEQTVALKVLGGARPDSAAMARFERERDLLSRLEHPGIARLIDGGMTEQGRPWFAMEYIEGRPIDAYCREHRLGLRARVELMGQVCEALDYAHCQMVLHRDIKPANILVDGNGRVRLVDFGLGGIQVDLASGTPEVTQLSRRWLTPEYASPEQLQGKGIDVRSEVYQLGLVLYRLLCADSPYEVTADSPAEWVEAVTHAEPTAPSERWHRNKQSAGEFGSTPQTLRRGLKGDMDRIVLMALRKERERRYTSASELGDDLERYLEGRPVEARSDGVSYRLGKFVSRHPWGLGAAVAGVIIAIGAAGLHIDRLQAERDRAQLEAAKAGMVSDFLIELFESADPARTRGEDLSVRDVLNQGGRQLDALDGEPAIRAELTGVLARVHRALGEYERSRELAEHAVELQRKAHGDEHPRVAQALNNLGQTYRRLARYDEAEGAHRQALGIVQSQTTVPGAVLGATYHYLGGALQGAGAYPESIEALEKALALRKSEFGENSQQVAQTLNEMAMTQFQIGEYGSAQSQWQKSLDIFSADLGTEHPNSVQIRSRLAATQGHLGDHAGAAAALSEVLEARRQIYGDRHPAVAIGLFELGFALYRAGDHSGAGEAWEACLEIQREIFEPNHPQVANTLQGLAAVAREEDDLDRAESLLDQVRAINEVQRGPRSSPVASTLNNLGTIRADRGDPEGALDLYGQSLDIFREIYGEEHANVAAVLHRMGEINLGMDHLEQAENQLNRALEIRELALPADHPGTAETRDLLEQLSRGRTSPTAQ